MSSSRLKKASLKFIVSLGIVSLFADMTYEGARSIAGPYLALLGASGTAVGAVIGLGTFAGYTLRGLFGYLSDQTGRYWLMTIVGYVINLLAVPLLAFAGSWQMAAFLIVMERFGKAIRVPARDALLSYATKQVGHGFGFGLHEALDQIGAVLGPLIISLMLFYKASYQMGFAALLIPAVLALLTLAFARISYPSPQKLETQTAPLKTKGFSKTFWLYICAVGLVVAGYADFALIAYHFQKASAVPPVWIPIFYSLAMGVDGLTALIIGKLFDLKGISVLCYATAISLFFAPLVFLTGFYGALFGMVLWGIGMGAQESILRGIVAALVSPNKRGSAYGFLNMSIGIFWAVGSAIMGLFYDISIVYLVIFSVIAQAAAIPLFLLVKIRGKT